MKFAHYNFRNISCLCALAFLYYLSTTCSRGQNLADKLKEAAEQKSISKLAVLYNGVQAMRTNYDPRYFGTVPQVDYAISSMFAGCSLDNLKAMSGQIQALWPNNPSIYFDWQSRLVQALDVSAATNKSAFDLIQKSCSSALEKPLPSNVLLVAPDLLQPDALAAKRTLFSTAAHKSLSAPSLDVAKLLARTLGEARALIIPNFHPSVVYMNVAPQLPPGKEATEPLIAGMSPKGIHDAETRTAYEKAILENCRKDATNRLQNSLSSEIEPEMKRTFMAYCAALFSKNPDVRKELVQLAQSAHLTDEETRDLEKK